MSGLSFEFWVARPGVVACTVAAAGMGWLGGSAPHTGHTSPHPGALPRTSQAAWRFKGEYGLYVGFAGRGLEVRWLTEEERPGRIRAIVGGRVVDERRTDPGHSHRARLRVEAPEVMIEYGSDGVGNLHRTHIRLEPLPPPDVDVAAPDSVFVLGDVHGEFERVVTLLQHAGLIDGELGWTGGRATVVLLGDLLDRGDDVTGLVWFAYRLESEAEAAGGRVLTLLGNHEAMVMSGDLRYVSPRELTIGDRHGLHYQKLFDPTDSILGRWLAAKPALVRIGDLLLAHGGVSPEYQDFSLRKYQETLRAYVSEPLFTRWHDPESLRDFARETRLDSAQIARRYNFLFAPESVLWYRDLVLTDTLDAHLDAVLERFHASIHVVAHTPVRTIRQSYGGKLIAVGLLDAAAEMLFLKRRRGGGWTGFAFPVEGDPRPLGTAP